MNSLQKSLLAIGSICVLLLCYFLFILKYDRFGSCAIADMQNEKYLVMETKSYEQLENKKTISIKNKTNSYEIKTKNSWQYVSDSDMWITPLDTYLKVQNGNYTIFLTQETVWKI